MRKEYEVNVTYKNDALETVLDKTYTLKEYSDMLRADLLRIITDIEDLIYEMNDNKPKNEWSDLSWASFCKIKHKLLDKAGAIGRLPDNIIERGDGDG